MSLLCEQRYFFDMCNQVSNTNLLRTVDRYPLSPLQEGLLYQSLQSPEQAWYTEQVVLTLQGEFNAARFLEGWKQVMARHDVLRGAVEWGGKGEPLLVIFEDAELPVTTLNWNSVSGSELAQKMESYLDSDRRRGIDVFTPPLMRLGIIHTHAESRIVFTFHHVLLDGWSFALVIQELLNAYAGPQQGLPKRLECGPSFREYITWINKQDQSAAEHFWKEEFRGWARSACASAKNHMCHTRRPVMERLAIGAESLSALSRRLRITLNTVVQGAWALLINSYTGEDDVVFGQVVSGRPAEIANFESMIGLCINTVPVRVPLEWKLPVIAWLSKLQRHQAEVREYFYSSLAQISRWSGLAPGSVLIDSLLDFHNHISVDDWNKECAGSGLKVLSVQHFHRNEYPLRALVQHNQGANPELIITTEYDPERFADIRANICETFLMLIMLLLQHPHQQLSELVSMASREPGFNGNFLQRMAQQHL
jgi:condensation domain-containing protein